VFQLDGVDVEVEFSTDCKAWRARLLGPDGEPRSGWEAGRRAWDAVELAVRGSGRAR
jgi:hypothetical protein